MTKSSEEKQAILEAKGDKARLCLSYRLIVWLILGLGSSLSSMGLSTQPAVFTCRRLATQSTRGSDPSTHNLTGQQGTWNLQETRQEKFHSQWNSTGERTGNSSENGARNSLNVSTVTVDTGYVIGATESPQSGATKKSSEGPLDGFNVTESEGWVLAAISIGYYVMQLPIAILSGCVGARVVSFGATLLSVMTSLLSVPALRWGPLASGVVCFLKGASSGALYPAMTSLASVWSGDSETSLVMSIVESGLQVGHAASFLSAAAFCDEGEGWAGVFYLQALLGILFGGGLWTLVKERPTEESNCVAIAEDEQRFLITSMQVKGVSSKKVKIPYRSIFTSLPVIAIIIAQLGSEWLDCLMVTSLPQFLGVRYKMDATSVELLTSVGFLLSIPVAVLGARVADWMLGRPHCHRSTVRKIFGALSVGFPGLCFLVLTYLEPGQVWAVVVVYVVGTCFTGLTDSAWPANCLDLAPPFTGFLVSLAEAATSWTWAVCVMAVACMTPQDTGEQWQMVMYVSGAFMLLCLLFYFMFGSSHRQPWADPLYPSVTTSTCDEE